ncbi:MAG: hypothetical protein R3300_20910 [Candidatus Promineifilaceae bacterium]|nr:hypothetical protein [Candidatus Promineifilaceae bacterium]
MNQAFWTTKRATGSLLVAGLFIALVALLILLVSGAIQVFAAALQGALEEMAPFADTFRLLTLMWAISLFVQLLGFGLLTQLLLRAGASQLPIVAFTLVSFALLAGMLHGTFHMSVEPWAAETAARTGSIPAAYEPLRIWIAATFRLGYVAHLVAVAGFGWAILRTRLLAPWLGWTATGWSVLWLLGNLVGVGAPGIILIMPAIIGVALLWR